MSWKLVKRVMDWPEPRNPGARMVLIVIAEQTRETQIDRGRYISFSEIALRSRLSRATVIRHIAALEAGGFLLVDRRDHQASIYRIPGLNLTPALVAERDHVVTSADADHDQRGHDLTPQGSQDDTSRGLKLRPNTGEPVSAGVAREDSLKRDLPTAREEIEADLTVWRRAAANGSRRAADRVAELEQRLGAAS